MVSNTYSLEYKTVIGEEAFKCPELNFMKTLEIIFCRVCITLKAFPGFANSRLGRQATDFIAISEWNEGKSFYTIYRIKFILDMIDDELETTTNNQESTQKCLKRQYDETSNLFPRHNDGGYITFLFDEKNLIEKHWDKWYKPIYKVIFDRYFVNGPNHNSNVPEQSMWGMPLSIELKKVAILLSRCQPYFRDQSSQRGDQIDSYIFPEKELHSHPLEWGAFFFAMANYSDGLIDFKVY